MRAVAIVRSSVWCLTGYESCVIIAVLDVRVTTAHLISLERCTGDGNERVDGEGFWMLWHAVTRSERSEGIPGRKSAHLDTS